MSDKSAEEMVRTKNAESKFILIEHNDGNSPATIHVFDTAEERIIATRKAILGDYDGTEIDLTELEEDGHMSFEGDPPLSWMRAFIEPDAYTAGKRAGILRASDHFLACLERLPRRPFASDWTDAITEVRIAAEKLRGVE